VRTLDKNCGTKDTHINFGESLDPIDWDEAEAHCAKADLVIVAGTSMTLRHITHMPFLAQKNTFGKSSSMISFCSERGKVAIVNLQKTPDDDKCDLRIFAPTDTVFDKLVKKFGLEMEHPPVFRPKDSVPLDQLPDYVSEFFYEAAVTLEEVAKHREKEWEARKKAANESVLSPSSTASSSSTTTNSTSTNN